MPKVIEVLVRNECHGQVWFTTKAVDHDPEDIQNPRHQEKGVRASPYQKDNFQARETE